MKNLFLILVVSFSVVAAKGHSDWGYLGEVGPAYWGDLDPNYSACKDGKRQSPIDIRHTEEGLAKDFAFLYKASVPRVENTGHGVKVNYESGSFFRLGNSKYELTEFHFHSPSEHTINGHSYPMEMHLVHKGPGGKLLMIGVLFRQGLHNDFLADVLHHFPNKQGPERRIASSIINAYNFLPEKVALFNYKGSLTTPPCSENVDWFIVQTPSDLSKEQLSSLEKLSQGNSRPTQLLHGRSVKRH